MKKIIITAKTHQGLVRTENQDTYYITENLRSFAVFDGMGGHSGGAVASNLAKQIFEQKSKSWEKLPLYELKLAIDNCIENADKEILLYGKKNTSVMGMGTTSIIASFSNEFEKNSQLLISNIGDSRAYLYRDCKLIQIGIDQSWINERIRLGIIPSEEEKNWNKNAIAKCLGCGEKYLADNYIIDIIENDIIILCSDGLHGYVTHTNIENCIKNIMSCDKTLTEKLNTICDECINLALNNGGSDNITVASCSIGDYTTTNINNNNLWILGSKAGLLYAYTNWDDLYKNIDIIQGKIFIASAYGFCGYLYDNYTIKSNLDLLQIEWTDKLNNLALEQINITDDYYLFGNKKYITNIKDDFADTSSIEYIVDKDTDIIEHKVYEPEIINYNINTTSKNYSLTKVASTNNNAISKNIINKKLSLFNKYIIFIFILFAILVYFTNNKTINLTMFFYPKKLMTKKTIKINKNDVINEIHNILSSKDENKIYIKDNMINAIIEQPIIHPHITILLQKYWLFYNIDYEKLIIKLEKLYKKWYFYPDIAILYALANARLYSENPLNLVITNSSKYGRAIDILLAVRYAPPFYMNNFANYSDHNYSLPSISINHDEAEIYINEILIGLTNEQKKSLFCMYKHHYNFNIECKAWKENTEELEKLFSLAKDSCNVINHIIELKTILYKEKNILLFENTIIKMIEKINECDKNGDYKAYTAFIKAKILNKKTTLSKQEVTNILQEVLKYNTWFKPINSAIKNGIENNVFE